MSWYAAVWVVMVGVDLAAIAGGALRRSGPLLLSGLWAAGVLAGVFVLDY